MVKQVILIRVDLKMSSGKIASQSSHASVEAVLKSDSNKIGKWRKKGMPKIVLKVKDLTELQDYKILAKKEGLVTALIKDAGKTALEPGTITALAIGPDEDSKIDKITKNLRLL